MKPIWHTYFIFNTPQWKITRNIVKILIFWKTHNCLIKSYLFLIFIRCLFGLLNFAWLITLTSTAHLIWLHYASQENSLVQKYYLHFCLCEFAQLWEPSYTKQYF